MNLICVSCESCGWSDERVVDRLPKMGDVLGDCPSCGRPVFRDIAMEHAGPRSSGSGWPKVEWASGVLPHQVKEARRVACQKMDRPPDFLPNGDVVLVDRTQRKEWHRLRGLHDLNAGYSDA